METTQPATSDGGTISHRMSPRRSKIAAVISTVRAADSIDTSLLCQVFLGGVVAGISPAAMTAAVPSSAWYVIGCVVGAYLDYGANQR